MELLVRHKLVSVSLLLQCAVMVQCLLYFVVETNHYNFCICCDIFMTLVCRVYLELLFVLIREKAIIRWYRRYTTKRLQLSVTSTRLDFIHIYRVNLPIDCQLCCWLWYQVNFSTLGSVIGFIEGLFFI